MRLIEQSRGRINRWMGLPMLLINFLFQQLTKKKFQFTLIFKPTTSAF